MDFVKNRKIHIMFVSRIINIDALVTMISTHEQTGTETKTEPLYDISISSKILHYQTL